MPPRERRSHADRDAVVRTLPAPGIATGPRRTTVDRLAARWRPWMTVVAVGMALIVAIAIVPRAVVSTWSRMADRTGDPAVAAEGAAAAVGQSFWYAGFQVDVVDATLTRGRAGPGELVLTARFTNLGPSGQEYPGSVAVVVGAGGQSYPAGSGSEFPSVPSGLAADGSLLFQVDPAFELEAAYLVAGGAGESQARVPLGRPGGERVTRQPSHRPVTGELSLALIDIRITSVELRADYPDRYRQVERGKLALTVSFDVTSRATRAGGGAVLSRDDFALILPGGNAVAADGGLVAEGMWGGLDYPGLQVRFLVDDPPTGDYALRFRSSASSTGFAGDGPAEDTATFSLR